MAPDGRMMDEQKMEKDFVRSGCGLTEVLSQNLYGGSEENHDQNTNLEPSEYKSRALPQEKSVRYL
jgi:hypothetical protein